jgi:tRNA-modifying protein YgfZ
MSGVFSSLAVHLSRIRVALAPLRSRSLTRLSGVDNLKFVQKLITNDVHLLDDASSTSLHAAVLSPQGRILHDVFVFRESSTSLLIDHCAASAESFRALLRRYRMRSDVTIDACADRSVVALFSRQPLPTSLPGVSFADTRHDSLGRRFVIDARAAASLQQLESELRLSGIDDLWRVDENIYDLYRTCLGVPSDPIEIVSGVSLPSEATLDYLNAISYDKGCYIGQELTARTHFVGTTRKMLLPIVPVVSGGGDENGVVVANQGSLFENWSRDLFGPSFGIPLPPTGFELSTSGGGKRSAGKVMRGGVWGAGFALIRLENLMPVDNIRNIVFNVVAAPGDDVDFSNQVKVIEPHWWTMHTKRFN